MRSKGRWFETYWNHLVVSLKKTLYRPLSTGSTQEDRNCPDRTEKLLAWTYFINTKRPINCIKHTVLPTKSDSGVLFCFLRYQGLVIDRSLVY